MRLAAPAFALITQILADEYPYASNIFKAARDGEIHSVRHFLKDRKFNTNQVDTWNKTAVHYTTASLPLYFLCIFDMSPFERKIVEG